MSVLVPIIVILIIAIQLFFFVKNVRRMIEYKNIFEEEKSWSVNHNIETSFVSGISGRGNGIFASIKDSINKYLGSNSGSVIDFTLLKDAVDRHCDSVEDDVNTLTPVPLYCGLAGTMAGVILGLVPLIQSGALLYLLNGGMPENFLADVNNGLITMEEAKKQLDLLAASGINELLKGVAWAMLASICGIFFTTVGSLAFKRFKLEGESGKNTFLAWLQAKLLPELPSDTSDALNRLVKNLNKFNNTFASNTTELRGALSQVNESYRIQGDIIKAVHDMDVMKMAKANVRVLEELKDCTDKLEVFNQYLDDIHGYTDAIHTFTTMFEQESNRLHVLEEIRDYFTRHKAEISKDTADVDLALRDSMRTLKEAAGTNAQELNSTLVQQAEEFKRIIREEKESFEEMNRELQTQLNAQLGQIPMLGNKLAEISAIPGKLDKLIEKIDQSNNNLASRINNTLTQTANNMKAVGGQQPTAGGGIVYKPTLPEWMKWSIVVTFIFVIVACTASIANTVYNIFFAPATVVNVEEIPADEQLDADSTALVPNQDVNVTPNVQSVPPMINAAEQNTAPENQ